MAAPLGFKDFNTGDVLTAGDVDGYLMQGIWVFANAAARDAAVTSPQEGNACYLKDTDVIQVYSGTSWVTKSGSASPLTTKGDLYTYSTSDARLAVGTNGQVLKANSATATGLEWGAVPASTKSYSLITSGTLSGSSTSVTGLSGYDNLLILLGSASSSTNGVALRITFNSDSGSNYWFAGMRYSSPAAYNTTNLNSNGTSGSGGTSSCGNQFLTSNNTNSSGYFSMQVFGANSTGIKTWTSVGSADAQTSSSHEAFVQNGAYAGTSVISSVQFVCTGGSWNAGHYRIYGAA